MDSTDALARTVRSAAGRGGSRAAAVGRGRLEPDRGRLALHARRMGRLSACATWRARDGSRARWHCRSVPRSRGSAWCWSLRTAAGAASARGCCGAAIDAARARGAAAGLDATELGRPVYLPLGFRDLYAISRWHLRWQPRLSRRRPASSLRPLTPADVPRSHCFRYTAKRHGPRPRAALSRRTCSATGVHCAKGGDEWRATHSGGHGRIAPQIGPVVAEDEAAALALVAHALAATERPRDDRRAGGAPRTGGLAEGAGRGAAARIRPHGAAANQQRRSTTRGNIFALAGPELG